MTWTNDKKPCPATRPLIGGPALDRWTTGGGPDCRLLSTPFAPRLWSSAPANACGRFRLPLGLPIRLCLAWPDKTAHDSPPTAGPAPILPLDTSATSRESSSCQQPIDLDDTVDREIHQRRIAASEIQLTATTTVCFERPSTTARWLYSRRRTQPHTPRSHLRPFHSHDGIAESNTRSLLWAHDTSPSSPVNDKSHHHVDIQRTARPQRVAIPAGPQHHQSPGHHGPRGGLQHGGRPLPLHQHPVL